MAKKIIQVDLGDESEVKGSRREFLATATKIGLPAVVAFSSRGAWGRAVDCTSAPALGSVTQLGSPVECTLPGEGPSPSGTPVGFSHGGYKNLNGRSNFNSNTYLNVDAGRWPSDFQPLDSTSTVFRLFTDFVPSMFPIVDSALAANAFDALNVDSSMTVYEAFTGQTEGFVLQSICAMLNARNKENSLSSGGSIDFLTPDEVAFIIVNRAAIELQIGITVENYFDSLWM